LYNHPGTNGWYEEPKGLKGLKFSDASVSDFQVQKGTLKGTYVITFTTR